MKTILETFGFITLILTICAIVLIAANKLGRRAVLPYVIHDMTHYANRIREIGVVDWTRFLAFCFLCYFPCVIFMNWLAGSFFPPSQLAARLDTAITTLLKLEEHDIECEQIMPDCIEIKHTARAARPWTWYRDNEKNLELPLRKNIIKWIIDLSRGRVLCYFIEPGMEYQTEIWIHDEQGLHRINLSRQHAYGTEL